MTKTAVYKRVSTDAQETAMQEHAISKWLAERGWTEDIVEFQDLGVSGKTMERPGFQALREAVDNGEVTRVVVYRLDRLSRDAIAVMRLLMDWMQRDIEFFAVDQPILSLGRDNPFRLTILSIFSELAQVERETIVSRIKTGLAAAKARGVLPGPKLQINNDQAVVAVEMKERGLSYSEIAAHFGVSKTVAFRAVKRGRKISERAVRAAK